MERQIDNSRLTKAVSPSSNMSGSVCSDYVNEIKLKRILTKSLQDPETIENLKNKKKASAKLIIWFLKKPKK